MELISSSFLFLIMEKKSVKSHPSPTDRHIEKSIRNHKAKREEILLEKRKGKQSTLKPEELKNLISNFPINEFLENPNPVAIVKKLVQILRTPECNQYYDQSNLYPENENGPFLFQNKKVLERLISFLHISQNMELLHEVTDALICISAHEEELTWSFEMIRCNFIPYGIAILDKCPDLDIKERIVWIFANLMADHVIPRSRILTFDRFQQVFVNTLLRHDKLIDISMFLFNCALFEEVPLKHVQLIWDTIINLLLTRAPNGDVLRVLVAGIVRGVRMNCDDYRINIVNNDHLLHSLINPKTQDVEILRMIATIMSSFMTTQTLHEKLVNKGILTLYYVFLNHKELIIRKEGCNGIYNAIVNGCLEPIVTHNGLIESIQRQFSISADNKTWERVRSIMFQILILSPTDKVFPNLIREKHWEKYIFEVISNNYIHASSPQQLFLALKALNQLLIYNLKYIREKLEDSDALTYVEQFAIENQNEDIRRMAEVITKRLDKTEEEDD
jgi:hypothetical protein